MESKSCNDEFPSVFRETVNLRETNVWICGPSSQGIFVYSLLVPTISALGIVGNILILAVLRRKTLKASTYTYLAGADLTTCVLLMLSGLARGFFWSNRGWREYDTFVYLPVGSVSSNFAVLATVCVTLDRIVLVSGPLRCTPPKFCDPRIARNLMWWSLPIVVICNLSYCFIYEYNDEGIIENTDFFNSWWYDLQNWMQLFVFGLIPAIFLLIGNSFLLVSVGKTIRKRQMLMKKHESEGNCVREQARLTVTLVGIVFVFLVGEVPTHLASRKSAISLLYGGDSTNIDEVFLERFRMWASVLNAVSSSASLVLYCLLNSQFLAHLKNLVTGVRDGPRNSKLKNCKQPPKNQHCPSSNQGIDFSTIPDRIESENRIVESAG